MKIIIDYRTGGMGNNIVSHVLYACNQIDIQFDKSISIIGDAHSLRKLYTNIPILPIHVHEQPELLANLNLYKIALEIRTTKWYKLIEQKMAYDKFFKDSPNEKNYKCFFNLDFDNIDIDKEWKRFYEDIKDDSWPECNYYADTILLPDNVCKEAMELFRLPETSVTCNNLLNVLTISYFDLLQLNNYTDSFFGGTIFLLDNYLANNLTDLKTVITKELNWTWDDHKSDNYYHNMIFKNRQYLDWLNMIKKIHDQILNYQIINLKLKTWEHAMLIAKIADTCKFHPAILPWYTLNNTSTSLELINFLKENNYGKTI